MTRAAALEELIIAYKATYGIRYTPGVGVPLGIIAMAGSTAKRPKVTGHHLLTVCEYGNYPTAQEYYAKDHERVGRVESLGPLGV